MSVLATRIKLKLRAGPELNSEPIGDIKAGSYVHMLEQQQLADADGTYRCCLALEGEMVVHGWVSTFARDGQANLIQVERYDGGRDAYMYDADGVGEQEESGEVWLDNDIADSDQEGTSSVVTLSGVEVSA